MADPTPPTLPSEHRAAAGSWLAGCLLGAVASIWLGFYLSHHPGAASIRLVFGVIVLGGMAIWMAVEWVRLSRLRLRVEDTGLTFTQAAGVQQVAWADITSIERQWLPAGSVGMLVVRSPHAELRLPKELEGLPGIIEMLAVRAPKAAWRDGKHNIMER